ncbi:twin-arginine translocase TatA/TatE family subunit [Halogeometricum borinquense]|uniref:Sec-independent protein translocase protein TatA n=1 Tax=Halogeometricum borinquense TaxID=60847 RepID=A0A6C0UEC0_9EURY|nr:twin-arginine translocase TatA/TatE family subunit [Halogeometricum borinquense]QIB73764.1 twin-arginine translocase TatA/TatE family subunit [Halogeometricum borinquense]QIQ76879.1 twin-arginine translocase TatA/TatE family subunit [Halogeometricum borinquense]
MFQITPLFPGIPGGPELLIVLLVLVLLFGANKIPKLARSTGQAMGEFQRGRNEIEEELKQMENNDDEDEDEETTTTTSTSTSTSSDSN